MHFATQNGLYLLLFVIPFIIIYLIKAKPTEVTIPSLIFFTGQKKVKKYNSFLRKLLVRTLFFIQLLTILFIAFSAADPIVQLPIDAYSLNTIVIVDVSASMNTRDTRIPRIDEGKQELLDMIKGRTSIILAEESPLVLARNISSSRARALITNIKAKDIATRIDSSILLANEMLGSDRGTIIVYSDFVLNKEDDILAAKKVAEANEKRVLFLSTGKPEENLGFVSMSLSRGTGEAFIKNFGKRKESVDINLKSDDKQDTKRIDIEPYSTERVTFEISKGETTLELGQNDRLESDDKAYIFNPYDSQTKILFITNERTTNPLLNALEANNAFDITIARPPVIPDLNFDVVVVSGINTNLILPNTFRDLKKYNAEGGKIIIAAQDNFDKINFQDLVGFDTGSLITGSNDVCVETISQITNRISSPRCFTTTSKFYDINLNDNNSVVLARVKDNPLLVLEDGIFYYGIIDKYSGFKDQISYPLFWDDVINALLGKEDLENFNFRTGNIVTGKNSSDSILLEDAGFIEIDGRRVAVNLLNNAESDIFRDSLLTNESGLQSEYQKVDLDVNLDQFILIIVLLLLGFELFYIKRRGDL